MQDYECVSKILNENVRDNNKFLEKINNKLAIGTKFKIY